MTAAPPPAGGAGPASPRAGRLPPGRHGIPAGLVEEHQRERLLEAAPAALAEQGYGGVTAVRIGELAGVSSRTFYAHFEDVWACLAAAHEAEAAHLRGEVEDACAAPGRARARAGIAAALAFLAAEPGVARLLCAEPPPRARALLAARNDLLDRLATLLRNARAPSAAPSPPNLERRLAAAALALVATRISAGGANRLPELEPELAELLLAQL